MKSKGNKLEQVVGQVMELGEYRSRSLNSLLLSLGQEDPREWEMLASNFYGGWGEENLAFKLEAEKGEVDERLVGAKKLVVAHESYKEVAKFNGETLALKDWAYDGEKLRANFVASDYFTYLAFREMEEREGEIPLGVAALGVGCFVITHDNMVVVAQRANGIDRGGKRSFSFGETLNMGEVRGDSIDVVGGAVRGAQEELGLNVERGVFVFTGWGVSRKFGNSTLWGLAYIKEDWSELWLGDDKWESESSKAVPFRVEEVLEELGQGDWDYSAQLGLVEALIYQYGVDAVFEAAAVRQT